VEFLGRPAHFSVGAFSIAQRTGAAVLPTFPVREHDGRNRIVIEPAMDLAEPGADDPKGEGAVAENTQRFARILERRVRQRPDHYMYFLSFRMLMAAGGDAAFIEGVV
jgi:KDO2-lipid IV(A) lauroyltransferase